MRARFQAGRKERETTEKGGGERKGEEKVNWTRDCPTHEASISPLSFSLEEYEQEPATVTEVPLEVGEQGSRPRLA